MADAEHLDIRADVGVRRPGDDCAAETGRFAEVVTAGVIEGAAHDDDPRMGHQRGEFAQRVGEVDLGRRSHRLGPAAHRIAQSQARDLTLDVGSALRMPGSQHDQAGLRILRLRFEEAGFLALVARSQ